MLLEISRAGGARGSSSIDYRHIHTPKACIRIHVHCVPEYLRTLPSASGGIVQYIYCTCCACAMHMYFHVLHQVRWDSNCT